jgi:hypothetical protein
MAKKLKSALKGLSLQFIPLSEIRGWNSNERIKNILDLVLENQIVIVQGRLRSEEEARLIGDTMAMIGHIPKFKGIELAVIQDKNKNTPLYQQVTGQIAKMLVGDGTSLTVIGPATIVKEIKKNPKKIELLIRE